MIAFSSNESENDYLTTEEAAEVLKLSIRTLERMRVRGDGPAFIKAGPGKGSRVLYLRSDIHKWSKLRRFNSTSEY